jgi:hypothetical protein
MSVDTGALRRAVASLPPLQVAGHLCVRSLG